MFFFKKKSLVAKVPDCYKSAPLVTKVPYNVTKVPCCRYKSALVTLQKCPWLQKFPTLVTKVPYPVTKVPFFRYKSARSYGSLSLPPSLSPSLSLSLSYLVYRFKMIVIFIILLQIKKRITQISIY